MFHILFPQPFPSSYDVARYRQQLYLQQLQQEYEEEQRRRILQQRQEYFRRQREQELLNLFTMMDFAPEPAERPVSSCSKRILIEDEYPRTPYSTPMPSDEDYDDEMNEACSEEMIGEEINDFPDPKDKVLSKVLQSMAARKIQKAWKSHFARQPKLQQLSKIAMEFEELTSRFENADVSLATITLENNMIPFNKDTKPLLEYEDRLLKLMMKLDEIQSSGDVVIRAKRKQVVEKILQGLALVDEKKNQIYSSSSSSSEKDYSSDDSSLSDSSLEIQRMIDAKIWKSKRNRKGKQRRKFQIARAA